MTSARKCCGAYAACLRNEHTENERSERRYAKCRRRDGACISEAVEAARMRLGTAYEVVEACGNMRERTNASVPAQCIRIWHISEVPRNVGVWGVTGKERRA